MTEALLLGLVSCHLSFAQLPGSYSEGVTGVISSPDDATIQFAHFSCYGEWGSEHRYTTLLLFIMAFANTHKGRMHNITGPMFLRSSPSPRSPDFKEAKMAQSLMFPGRNVPVGLGNDPPV